MTTKKAVQPLDQPVRFPTTAEQKRGLTEKPADKLPPLRNNSPAAEKARKKQISRIVTATARYNRKEK
jgi:hypothetical protein